MTNRENYLIDSGMALADLKCAEVEHLVRELVAQEQKHKQVIDEFNGELRKAKDGIMRAIEQKQVLTAQRDALADAMHKRHVALCREKKKKPTIGPAVAEILARAKAGVLAKNAAARIDEVNQCQECA